ncbi:MAG: hypothetical protein AAGB48_07185 [Planctomycetota bacterium]
MHTKLLMPLAALACVGIAGCASIEVRRVKDDKDGDKVDGFRYYLPRPYVSVKKPFPVGGSDSFVTGTIQGDAVVVDAALLPAFMQHRAEDGLVSIAFNEIQTPSSPPSTESSGTGGDEPAASSDSSASDSAEATRILANNEALDGSAVTPKLLQIGVDTFTLTLKFVPNKAGLMVSSIDAGSVQIGLLKADGNGKPDTSSFTAIPTKTATMPTADDKTGTWVAEGRRTDLPGAGNYVIAIRLKSKNGTDEETLLIHRNTAEFSVIGEVKQKEPKSQDRTSTKSIAHLTTSGNPDTDPLKQVNDYFDVLYLPDFDQQYAIKVRGRFGMADADIGLEDGWLMERANISVDNRELGEFVFSNINKFTDIAADAAKAALNLASGGTTGAAEILNSMASQAETPFAGETPETRTRAVLLRVRYVAEAQPGLYPILKPNEAQHTKAAGTPPAPGDANSQHVFLPTRPYTLVAYNVRHQILIELIQPAGN